MEKTVEWIRGLEQTNRKRKKIHFKFKDIGPSTEETSNEIFKLYQMIDRYQDGKTFDELLDEANDPILYSDKYKKELIFCE